MNRMKKWLLLLVMASMTFAHSAMAQSYVTAEVGPYFPDEGFLDNGFNLEFAYGYMINPNLSVEAGLGWYSTEAGVVDIDVVPITATALYHFPFQQTPLTFYGGGGLGLYFWDVDNTGRDQDDVEFGINFVGGGLYDINQQFGLSVELEYDLTTEDGIDGWFFNFGGRYRF